MLESGPGLWSHRVPRSLRPIRSLLSRRSVFGKSRNPLGPHPHLREAHPHRGVLPGLFVTQSPLGQAKWKGAMRPSSRPGPGLVTPALHCTQSGRVRPRSQRQRQRQHCGGLPARDLVMEKLSSGWGSPSIMPQQTLDVLFRGRSERSEKATRKRIQPPDSQGYSVLRTQKRIPWSIVFSRGIGRVPEEARPPCRQPGFARPSESG